MRILVVAVICSFTALAAAGSLSEAVLGDVCADACTYQSDAGVPGDATDDCGEAAADRPPVLHADDGGYSGQVILAEDPVDVFIVHPETIGQETTVVLTWALAEAGAASDDVATYAGDGTGAYRLVVLDDQCQFVAEGHYHENATLNTAYRAAHFVPQGASTGLPTYYAQVMRVAIAPELVLGFSSDPVQAVNDGIGHASDLVDHIPGVGNCHDICGKCTAPLDPLKYGLCQGLPE